MKKALFAAGTFITFVITIASLLYMFQDLKKTIIWSVIIVIGALCVMAISLSYQNYQMLKTLKKKENELSELRDRHATLSKLYSVKRKKLDAFENLWSSLNTVFVNTLQGSKEKRFEQAYNLYLQYTQIKDNYEEDNK